MATYKYILPVCFISLFSITIISCSDEESPAEEKVTTVVVEQPPLLQPGDKVYSSWEEYYNNMDNHFQVDSFVITDTTYNDLLIKKADLNDTFYQNYGDLIVYNKDSSMFIDPYSYSLIIETKNGKRIARGGEVDNEVSVVDLKKNIRTRLLFFGPSCQFQNAFWYNDHIVGVMGLQSDYSDEYYTPRIWFVNINNGEIMPYEYNDNINIVDGHGYLDKYLESKGIEIAY